MNNKRYIGSAAGHGFCNRWNLHKNHLENHKHTNTILQRAWNKYGANAFIFEVLELCSPDVCVEREQHWLDTTQPEYNICKIAGSTLGFRHTQESKMRISKAKLGENNHQSKLTSNDIYQIRKLIQQGVTQKVIASKFHVTPMTISYIKTGKRWSHI